MLYSHWLFLYTILQKKIIAIYDNLESEVLIINQGKLLALGTLNSFLSLPWFLNLGWVLKPMSQKYQYCNTFIFFNTILCAKCLV